MLKGVFILFFAVVILSFSALRSHGQDVNRASSLDSATARLDSLHEKTTGKLPDSVTSSVKVKMDSISSRVDSYIDSLGRLNLPVMDYAKRVDSLYRSLTSRLHSLTGRDALKERHLEVDKMDSVLAQKTQFLDSLLAAQDFDGVADLSEKLKLPSKEIPHLTLGLPGLPKDVNPLNLATPQNHLGSDLSSNLPVTPNALTVSDRGGAVEIVKQVEGYAGQTTDVSKKASELKTQDVPADVTKVAEEQVREIGTVKALGEETRAAEDLKRKSDEVTGTAKDPNVLKERANARVEDFLAGKEDVVKKDLDNIGKVQLKYRNIADSRFLPKRPPNAMKGKPFIERLIPGISLQIVNAENILVDVAPFIGYRLSGRISATIGGYRRIVYIKKDDVLKALDCYGFRAYNNIRVFGAFSTHLEVERYRADDIFLYTKAVVKEDHSWKNKVNFGVFNRYSIGKNVYGHVVVMYDLLQIRKFPNTSGAAARFGFDYQFQKKKKK